VNIHVKITIPNNHVSMKTNANSSHWFFLLVNVFPDFLLHLSYIELRQEMANTPANRNSKKSIEI
jgi:hypothetical protein